MDSTTCPKVKIMEGEGIGARSLAPNSLGVEGVIQLFTWTYTKPNNKLVSA
jgi:hypothetical protein